jgi:4-carboxymuconolactone decarboxylase
MALDNQLPTDLVAYRETYADMFGFLPGNLDTRFNVSGRLDPDFLRLHEQLRAATLYNTVFDAKITQLLVFAAFLSTGQEAAPRLHALAARRAGASWEELHKIVEIVCTVSGFGILAIGDKIIADLQAQEQGQEAQGTQANR